MKAKLLHLPDTVVLTISVEAAKNSTDFKNYCQSLIIAKANSLNNCACKVDSDFNCLCGKKLQNKTQ